MFVTLMNVGAARVRQRRRPAYDKSDELVAPRRRIDCLELPLGDKGPVGSAASAEESGSGALRMMTTGGISAEHVVDGMHSALKSLTHCVSFSPYDKSQRSSFAVWKQASLPEATHAKYIGGARVPRLGKAGHAMRGCFSWSLSPERESRSSQPRRIALTLHELDHRSCGADRRALASRA